jgi:hypothetical protein
MSERTGSVTPFLWGESAIFLIVILSAAKDLLVWWMTV